MQWKRSRRPGLRFGRIVLVALLLALAAAVALHRQRPLPLPWHPVGSERIVTPALDIADPRNRAVMLRMASRPLPGSAAASLLEHCRADAPGGPETYLLTWVHLEVDGYGLSTQVRIDLDVDGEAIIENTDGDRRDTSRRRLDARAADAIRTLLLDAGYPRMAPYVANASALSTRPGDPESVSLQSCIGGRYYGVIRRGGQGPDGTSLQSLVDRIGELVGGDAASAAR